MRGKRTIVINGQQYDAATGMSIEGRHNVQVPKRTRVVNDITPLEKPALKFADHTKSPATKEPTKTQRSSAAAAAVHSTTQRSQTLRRSALKKPQTPHTSERRHRAVVSKSPHITKFAPHPQPVTKKVQHTVDTPAASSPTHHKKAAPQSHRPHAANISSRAIKEHLISQQLEHARPAHPGEELQPKKHGRKFSIASAGLALILLGGYLTYINMPSLSIRVAAAQAGIDASLPEYRPDGYRFNGPVAYSQGEVDMTFSANAGPQKYTITQKASDWDSQAVLDNYVLEESDGKYNIHSTQGLTVYTFDSKAAWVNNGILHIVDYADAPLSNNQIERIAASM